MKASRQDFSINQEILGNLSNIENLVIKLNSHIGNPKLSSQVVFRAIYKILEKDVKAALTIITNYKCNFKNKSYLALMIKIYALNNMFDEALQIYNSIPDNSKKKRFIIEITFIINNYCQSSCYIFFQYFIYCSKNYLT